ncbi:hypothetical protein B0F90DRAFT_1814941 [Multifurca ochricompacta]|uniref:Uncharacterized protein n=1 Tax=Multifurca ochricompacta TaxID=376703 RepID=A0AAD4QNS6_9AGAM|nr:hypothetical protein B0F90DRAFT_1814941 [Multifurca ochricompacta]
MAAAAVTSNISSPVSTPLRVVSSRMAVNSGPPSVAASTFVYPSTSMASTSTSSRLQPQSPAQPAQPSPTTRSKSTHKGHSTSIDIMSSSSSSPSSESAPKTFKRLLRSPFEQTIRSATRSKGKLSNTVPLPAGDDLATITAKDDSHGCKETTEVKVTEVMAREVVKERTGIFKRFETKVALRRTRKESATELLSRAPIEPSYNIDEDLASQDRLPSESGRDQHRFRLAGLTSFVTPSLRQASFSSPALQLSSHTFSSPSSPSSSPSPNRPIISAPAPLSPKRPSVGNANSPASPSPRPRKSRPDPLLPSSPSTPSFDRFTLSSSPAPSTPTRPGSREPVSPPGTPTRASSSRQPLGKRTSASTAAARTSLDQPPSGPSTSRQKSPNSPRTRSPPPPRVVTPRGFTSASTSNLNYPPSYSTNAIRRSSIDRRSPSPALPRASSPTTPSRPRAISPTHHQHHQHPVSPATPPLTRHTNGSTTSLSHSGPYNPMHREAVRTATSVLCKEMLRPGQSSSLAVREADEVEVRMRALARLERIWGRSGASSNGSATQLGVMGASAAGEERERRLFTEALRDGYVLCQLMNKLRPGSIARIDPREDGKLRTSNVTKFLASCSANGLPPEDLFLRDDLIEGTSDCLARVAKTIIALVKWAETPVPTQSRLLRGGGNLKFINTSVANASANGNGILGSPYRTGSSSRAVMSSPNLSAPLPSHLSQSPSRDNTRRRTPPSAGLLTSQVDSSDDATSNSDRDEVPPILPSRSPIRSWPSERSLIGDSPLAPSFGESARVSIADSTTNQSIASSNITDTSTYSSLLDAGIGNVRSSGAFGKFGTIRTVTTEATSFVPSEWPSMTRAEGSATAASMVACNDIFGNASSDGNNYSSNSPNPGGGITLNARRRSLENPVRPRERKPSETVPVDLLRVVEESEELLTGGGGVAQKSIAAGERMQPIKLGKGKWPDDFLDTLQAQNYVPSRPIAIRKPSPSSLTLSADAIRNDDDDFAIVELGDRENGTATALSASASPPHSLEAQLQPLVVRRPTHRARHSVDAPVLAPKDSLLRRDSSPDTTALGSGLAPPGGRVALRRNSTRNGIAGQRNGIYVPRRSSPEGSGGDSDSFIAIPFPRAVSGEHVPSPSSLNSPSSPLSDSVERVPSAEHSTGSGSGSATGSASGNVNSSTPPPLLPRGRFQSEVDGASSRRRPRPSSYDEFGAKPRRSRFESMVNLGVASTGHASASDLMARDATEGSVSRQTLVVREEGKAPTHFQLGNCIGRGQFGAVYRALNLNTGQMVAVKRIGLEGLKEEEIAQLMREVDLVKRLSHPSIVKYEGMARDENTLSIVLEYAENGSLGQLLKAFGKLNEKLVASYVVKILEGLDYLHRSDVVHCDLKAANILTTKNGNVKLSDFGVSLNLRAMEREIKDVAGTPNWMAPEVIELKGASTKSDIWSLGCTVIELLTGRPPYGDIANTMTVMFRIVEDDCPPIPERFSGPLAGFLKECFHKDPAQRPSAEELFEHEWLKNHWGLNKDLRPQDSIPFLRRVSADLQKNDVTRQLIANLDLVDAAVPEFARADDMVLSSSPGRRSFVSASPILPELPQAEPDLFAMREHTFVKTTFSKPVSCRVCVEPVKKGAVLCSHCSLIAHSKCAARAPPTCDLRSKLLWPFADRGSPSDMFPRLPHPAGPTSDGFGASSSRGSLDRERTSSPQLSASSSPHPPVAYKVLLPFKRSRASLTPDPTHSNSSVSLAAATPPVATALQHHQIKSVLPEGNIIRRKLSIILTRQKDPHGPTLMHTRERPHSISSIGSSSPRSPQSNSMRSMQTAAESMSSRAARVDPSLGATESSADVDGAGMSIYSDTSIVADGFRGLAISSRQKEKEREQEQEREQNTQHRTRRGRGESKASSSSCAIQ